MKDFNHPNVLSLIGVVMNEQKLPMVVIPFMSKGDLKKVLKDESEVGLNISTCFLITNHLNSTHFLTVAKTTLNE